MLVANIVDPFSDQAAKGAIAAAEQLDVNLIIVPGKYICQTSYSNSDTVYEYQYNNLFAYVNSGNVDAACVCTGTIAYANTDNEKKAFLDRLGSDMPVISIASKIEGYEYVVFDNTESVRNCVNYMIREQGKRKIAILSGYIDNSDYKERLEGYKLALADNGIEYDEELVVFCNPSRACREDAEGLLDRHPEIEAIVCSNDDMCVAVYEICADRGMKIGTDILVSGFDDMDYAEKLEPPLSSVRASAEDLGYRAVMNAYTLLEGNEITVRNVPTRFIPRLSCGYVGSRLSDIDIYLQSKEDRIGKLMYFIFGGTENCRDAYLIKNMKTILGVVEKVEGGAELESDDVMNVIESAEKMINYDKNYFLYLKNIHMVADACYDRMIKTSMSESSKLRLENLYLEIYRLISRDVGNLVNKAGEASIDMLRRSNILVRDTLMISGSMADVGSYSAILRRLPLLEVNSSYLYLLPEPVRYLQGDKLYDISKWNLMSYSHFDDMFDVPENERELALSEIFTHKFIPKDKRVTLVMADLYSGEYQYGFMLCELKKQFFEYLEFITYQFGAAVKILRLFSELDRHMNELNDDNAVLEGISRKDELTGLLNRRGFYAEAEDCLEKYKGTDKYAVIVFADLDYLKFINDRYGHNEGDYALRASADILRKLFRSTDIIARTGGDEFNIMAVVSEPEFEKRILERKRTCVEALNSTAGKPYRIDLSMGICEFKCSDIDDLSTVIEQADNKLYQVKRARTYNPYLNEAQ